MLTLITGEKGDVGSLLMNLYRDNGKEIIPFDKEKNIRANRILHLAAKSPPATSGEIVDSNILYLREVIEYACNNDIRELIFFSAVSIYGNQDKEDVCESDCIVEPNLYGVSKLLGEKLLSEAPFNVLSIRLPAVLGIRNKTNFLSRCYTKLKSNEEIGLTNSDRLFNNFISVENIFEFLTSLKLKKQFEIINLASKKEMTLMDIVMLMKVESGSHSKVASFGDKKPFFNISTLKAQKEYGFIPSGAKETIVNWLKERVMLEGSNKNLRGLVRDLLS